MLGTGGSEGSGSLAAGPPSGASPPEMRDAGQCGSFALALGVTAMSKEIRCFQDILSVLLKKSILLY